ncbi:tannase/feruloyl esterase family alpha/beta hydrolase [Paenibacillus sp. LMG 31461]|uniref:Tannase/feruloyl esterase family alpha/beta hydrolase n=1 Tax=Paenibacillus plantarum TaxID=2654975 RepID=A0ABX1X606_9BACL|nr:tannase/feruloyl esterase family alpha/beta hydrolase [Paenibacillus plantarum]NOU63868.1 tannase/feruloyl esterase family alpha/beta hydrolase [Paenibacillus plantarum]
MEGIFKNVDIPGCTIMDVQMVPEGSLTLEDGRIFTDLPEFCRVCLQLRPTSDSNIRVELWLPQDWNGRFLGTGNGGSASYISYNPLALGVRRGYATANTDMGTSPNAFEAIGHPERWVDFGYRATHEMTVAAKSLIQLYYRKSASYAYFMGCSTGGQQALMEAQRYPSDYHGIIAGAPANNRTHLHTGFLWNFKATNQRTGAHFSKEQIASITRKVVEHGRGKDGGVLHGDNFFTDPRVLQFGPETLAASQVDDDGVSLTEEQISALKLIYAGPTNPRTGERIYTPLPFGSEACGGGLDLQQDPEQLPSSLLYPFHWVFGADFDYSTFDFDHDLDTLNERLAPILNANNPDVSEMKALGGKILLYTGMADPLVPYQDALHYYERVIEHQGGLDQTQDFFRLFLVPGMGHCGGGPGLNEIGFRGVSSLPVDREHDILAAMVDWVEHEKAPDTLIATAFIDGFAPNGMDFQRPIFP